MSRANFEYCCAAVAGLLFVFGEAIANSVTNAFFEVMK